MAAQSDEPPLVVRITVAPDGAHVAAAIAHALVDVGMSVDVVGQHGDVEILLLTPQLESSQLSVGDGSPHHRVVVVAVKGEYAYLPDEVRRVNWLIWGLCKEGRVPR